MRIGAKVNKKRGEISLKSPFSAYGLSVMVIQFATPLVCCTLCYWGIARKIQDQVHKRQENQVRVFFARLLYPFLLQRMLPSSERRMLARRRRTNLMMATMVMGFVISWLPMNILNVMRDLRLIGGTAEWCLFMQK